MGIPIIYIRMVEKAEGNGDGEKKIMGGTGRKNER